jgi:hypothetical protein
MVYLLPLEDKLHNPAHDHSLFPSEEPDIYKTLGKHG